MSEEQEIPWPQNYKGVRPTKSKGLRLLANTILYIRLHTQGMSDAEAMTLNQVDDELRAKLKAQWSEDTIVELTGMIAFQNLSSKFNAALDVPAQGFCRLPARRGDTVSDR